MKNRYLFRFIDQDLSKRRQMIFISGPRQVGKTTLALSLLDNKENELNYFNWDLATHRRVLVREIFSGKRKLSDVSRICFDEIHKYSRWKNSLKGLFDTHEPNTHWIVTGSANLSTYRRGQDSMVGRYFSYTLHPYSVAELLGKIDSDGQAFAREVQKNESPDAQSHLERLMKLSGFPEPFFNDSLSFLRRWQSTRIERLIHQDLAQTENVKNLPLVEHLVSLLPERVASSLSINALRQDLEVHFETVKHWLDLLERVYYGFFLRPYSTKLPRGIKKEPKFYLWDWTEVEEPGRRFENLVAVHLYKWINFVNEMGLDSLSLHYVRDKEDHEVDFLICRKRKPWVSIECKKNASSNPASIYYFSEKLNLSKSFVLSLDRVPLDIRTDKGRQIVRMSAADFLANLV